MKIKRILLCLFVNLMAAAGAQAVVAATAQSAANWSADATWVITGCGSGPQSGTNNLAVVNSTGVCTPAVSPVWTVDGLIGRRLNVAGTYYDITDNDATTCTISSPPADGDYTWNIGGKPIAGDEADLATYAVVWDADTAGNAVIPAAGALSKIYTATSGQLTAALTLNAFHLSPPGGGALNVTTITNGTGNADTGMIVFTGTPGAAHGVTITMTGGSITGGGTGGTRFGVRNYSSGGLTIVCPTITGGSGTRCYGVINGAAGTVTITGPAAITGGTGLSAAGVADEGTAAGCTLTNCNLVNSATSMAYSGRAPAWNITGNANYVQWYVGSTPGSAANTKFGPEPADHQLLLNVVCGDITGNLTLPNNGSPPYTADAAYVLTTGYYGPSDGLTQGTTAGSGTVVIVQRR